VVSGVLAGLAGAVLGIAGVPADCVAHVAIALSDATLLLVPEDEARNLDVRDGDTD
jgi:hypothetical protein